MDQPDPRVDAPAEPGAPVPGADPGGTPGGEPAPGPVAAAPAPPSGDAAPGSAPDPGAPAPDPVDPALAELAALHGVATEYRGTGDRLVRVPASTVVAVLAALGVDARTPRAVRAALAVRRRLAAAQLLPPCVVTRAGRPYALPVPEGTALRIELEDGRTREVPPDGALPGDLPTGYHTLHATAPSGPAAGTDSAPLITAPDRLPAPPRGWGFLAQLYSVLSDRSWGIGDLADLAALTTWAGRLGADFVQINPLHAALPVPPADPSPYRPATRAFPDPVHLAADRLPEYAALPPAHAERVDQLAAEAAAFRHAVLLRNNPHDTLQLINRDAVWRVKREALALLHAAPRSAAREDAYRAYVRQAGRRLEDHATWCALAEAYGGDVRAWPDGLRDPASVETAAFRVSHPVAVDFHRWLAWLADEQLAQAQTAAREAGMAVGVIHDLAVGAHPDGSDAWALGGPRGVLAADMSIGAPPDAFTPHGQDWGLPPWRPDALARTGYAPYRELLRSVLRHAGGLRVDHVMGLFRLWWIPEGRPATEGTYVQYDAEAMVGVLALEAERAGAVVIGEDLGTVEPRVRRDLADRGILGTGVLWFERDHDDTGGAHPHGRPKRPAEWRELCLATLTTHDLPSTAARLTGEHVALRHRLGLLAGGLAEEQEADAEERAEWTGLLHELGLLPDGTAPGGAASAPAVASPPGGAEARKTGGTGARETGGTDRPDAGEPTWDGGAGTRAVTALYRYLRRTPALLTGVWLPDTVGDRRPQNLPGTVDEYPNWRLPLADGQGRPVPLEELERDPRPAALARALAAEHPDPRP